MAGGGLAGLIIAIELSRAGHRVLVIEKKEYPFHKVCGEYVSHEVLDYLKALGFDPYAHGAARITKLRVSAPSGRELRAPLELGGFGLSRYVMDDALQQLARYYGAKVLSGERVSEVKFKDGIFNVFTTDGGQYDSMFAVGSWGKRDVMDKKLERDFLSKHTGYMAVKHHIRTDYPVDEIGLDNFPGGYCGISKVEGDLYNLCYLYQRDHAGSFKTIPELEEAVLFKNPILKGILKNSDFVLPQPEVINEISFAPKQQVEGHVMMCGDTAGLITPLCGNGMSMAIAAAQMLARIILDSKVLQSTHLSAPGRAALEHKYTAAWQARFGRRLSWGRGIQRFFGKPRLCEAALRSLGPLPSAQRWLISKTHGTPVEVIPVKVNKYWGT